MLLFLNLASFKFHLIDRDFFFIIINTNNFFVTGSQIMRFAWVFFFFFILSCGFSHYTNRLVYACGWYRHFFWIPLNHTQWTKHIIEQQQPNNINHTQKGLRNEARVQVNRNVNSTRYDAQLNPMFTSICQHCWSGCGHFPWVKYLHWMSFPMPWEDFHLVSLWMLYARIGFHSHFEWKVVPVARCLNMYRFPIRTILHFERTRNAYSFIQSQYIQCSLSVFNVCICDHIFNAFPLTSELRT